MCGQYLFREIGPRLRESRKASHVAKSPALCQLCKCMQRPRSRSHISKREMDKSTQASSSFDEDDELDDGA